MADTPQTCEKEKKMPVCGFSNFPQRLQSYRRTAQHASAHFEEMGRVLAPENHPVPQLLSHWPAMQTLQLPSTWPAMKNPVTIVLTLCANPPDNHPAGPPCKSPRYHALVLHANPPDTMRWPSMQIPQIPRTDQPCKSPRYHPAGPPCKSPRYHALARHANPPNTMHWPAMQTPR